MNYAIIKYIIGWILVLEAAFMLLPCVTALIYGESAGLAFIITMALCVAIGSPLIWKKPKKDMFSMKDGCVSVALSWIVLSIAGAIPFVVSGSLPNPVDALFETVSGFTTTGASVVANVEGLPHCIIMWRSFTHWIGGMGVLVFLLALLPMTGGSRMNLMKAESPGPSVSRIVPKVKASAKILYLIYFALTVLQFVLMVAGRMPIFDAMNIAFGTAGTGGFAIKNDSIAGYSNYLQIIITIFMILFGVNFNVYFLLLCRKWKQAFSAIEVRIYFLIIFISSLIIAIDIVDLYSGAGEALRHAFFQVGSIITTTGFATTDFSQWPQTSRTILVMLMFIGACAGSTGGGIKVSRFIILLKNVNKELHSYLHPRRVQKIQMDGKIVEHEVIRSTNAFLTTYLVIFAFSVLILGFEGHDLVTNFTAVATALNNVGPGLNMVGPTCNFGFLTIPSKLVLIFDMLAGRLELFPLLLLFVRSTWRKF